MILSLRLYIPACNLEMFLRVNMGGYWIRFILFFKFISWYSFLLLYSGQISRVCQEASDFTIQLSFLPH